jgi:isopentenyl-diphosphate delta-isomerase
LSEDLLIAVDHRGRAIKPRARTSCHSGDGVLHRAFSVYLFDERRRLLVQQRSIFKQLWPRFWANSCCSHPRWGEATVDAAHRRVEEELGIRVDLQPVFAFRYRARFGNEGSEYEHCHVFIGRSDPMPAPDPREVGTWAFVEPERLKKELEAVPEVYTPWLHIGWRILRVEHWNRVERLCRSPE